MIDRIFIKILSLILVVSIPSILAAQSCLNSEIQTVRLGGQPGDVYIGPVCNSDGSYRTCFYLSGVDLPGSISSYLLLVDNVPQNIAGLFDSGLSKVICTSFLPSGSSNVDVAIYTERSCFINELNLFDAPVCDPVGAPAVFPPPVSCPSIGLCSDEQTGPGCEDCDCQQTVCSKDPYCCGKEWDELCVLKAQSSCESNCQSVALTEAKEGLSSLSQNGFQLGKAMKKALFRKTKKTKKGEKELESILSGHIGTLVAITSIPSSVDINCSLKYLFCFESTLSSEINGLKDNLSQLEQSLVQLENKLKKSKVRKKQLNNFSLQKELLFQAVDVLVDSLPSVDTTCFQ